MKLLIFGNGYIASEFVRARIFDEVVIAIADITRSEEIRDSIKLHMPDAILNAAGKANLEWCRDNPARAAEVNIMGPLTLLDAAEERGIPLVHLGSGCIFEGRGSNGGGFSEDDPPSPQCFYAHTKTAADTLLLTRGYDKLLILRIRQPFSGIPHPRNLITKVLSYEKLITSPNSMTYIPDLVAVAKKLLEKGERGVFHVCNEGTLSPYDMAFYAKKTLGIVKEFVPITKEELDRMDAEQKREHRVDTIINTDRLKAHGIMLPQVTRRLKDALHVYAAS